MTAALPWLGVAVLGGLGAVLRVALSRGVAGRAAHWVAPVSLGTAVVNLIGSLALGMLVGAGVPSGVELAVGTGLLGAFTTFSTWILEVEAWWRAGRRRLATTVLLGSIVCGYAVTVAGFAVGRLAG